MKPEPPYPECAFCHQPVKEKGWVEVRGWSNPQSSGARHAGSQIVHRERTGRVAHELCARLGQDASAKMFG